MTDQANRVALLFPGQGSQAAGMGREFAEADPAARALYDAAGAELGYDLAALCFDGPEEALRQTRVTQPALYVTSCAALEALRARADVRFEAAAGHSVGEYAALYAAGAFDFATGLRLVARRAELMQHTAARSPGGMAAVLGMDVEAVRDVCDASRAEGHGVVVLANDNSPGQAVISGQQAALDRACELARERGARRVVPLNVSGAFHSPLMANAGDALHAHLRQAVMRDTRVPVVVNVTADYCRHGVDFAPYLTMQVSGAVRWRESMQRLVEDGHRTFLELGSGEVLAGLLRRVDKSVTVLSVRDAETLGAAVELLAGSA